MDPDLPPGMGGFFQGMLGDLLKLLRTDAPLQWDLALQLAQSVASDGASEPNVEPVERIRLEELTRIAELHVADVTGMTTGAGGRPLAVVPTGRAEWARRSLLGWRGLFESIAKALGPAPGAAGPPAAPDAQAAADLGAFLGQWASTIAPAMIAMQVGSLVGHLAQRALGQYDLPLPRTGDDELVVVAANRRIFAEDWGLPADDVSLWLTVRDVAVHAVLARSHVRDRLTELLVAHAEGFSPDPHALEARLGEVGPAGDLPGLTRLLGDPAALGELVDTPELRRVRAELDALVATIEGYAQWVTDTIGARAIGARVPVREALRRRRVERGEDERGAEALLGLALSQELVDRGEAFVRGVLERGAEAELAALWTVPGHLPTPAEVDAPGLWIARVNLPPLEPGETAR